MQLPISPQPIRFVQDADGKRVAQPLSPDEREEEKKEIGVVVIGHIGAAQEQLLEVLCAHKIAAKKILIVAADMLMSGSSELSPLSLEAQLQKLSEEKILITRPPIEIIPEIVLEQEVASHTNKHVQNFAKHHTPKTRQKSSAGKRKYTPRKK